MEGFIDSYTASQLIGVSDRRLRKRVDQGKYEVIRAKSERGGGKAKQIGKIRYGRIGNCFRCP